MSVFACPHCWFLKMANEGRAVTGVLESSMSHDIFNQLMIVGIIRKEPDKGVIRKE